jgi:uncharacterized protein DUF6318
LRFAWTAVSGELLALRLLPVSVKLRTVAIAVSALALLATAACGGGGGTSGNAAGGAGSAQKQAPAPTLPAAATKNTTEGAEAFTRYFFASINHAFATGRTDGLVKATAPTCEICRATIGDVSYAFARGQIRGGELTIQKIGAPNKVGPYTNRLVTYSEAKYEEVGHDGKVLYSVPAKKGFQLVVKLVWTGTGWQVAQMNRHGKAPSSPAR